MPLFDPSPFAALTGCALALSVPSYGWGSLNTLAQPTRFVITNAVSLGGTATLTGTITEGNIPAVGDLLTTQVDNANFTVTNKAISAVSITAATGVGTISYANASNVASVAITGVALVPLVEQSETLVNGGSKAFCFQSNDANTTSARSIKAVVNYPTLPSTGKTTLQSAINRTEAEFFDLVTVGQMTGGVFVGGQVTVTLEPGKWYRFNNTLVSGGPGKIIAKLIV